jgi:alpha-glucosidase (family GH31 glycosyl hydrolase)
VWFPPGRWTDYFTGQTYTGGTTADVTSGLDTMPVFVRAGGIVATRTDDVTNNDQNPLAKVTLTIAEGASGSFTLYEDDSTSSPKSSRDATTKIEYSETGTEHVVKIGAVAGSFRGQVSDREWTVAMLDATEPTDVAVNGTRLGTDAYRWDGATNTLTVKLPPRSILEPITVTYR